MRGLITAVPQLCSLAFMAAAYAAGDLSKCEKPTGSAKDKCIAEEWKK